jgi:hypothetical protein
MTTTTPTAGADRARTGPPRRTAMQRGVTAAPVTARRTLSERPALEEAAR